MRFLSLLLVLFSLSCTQKASYNQAPFDGRKVSVRVSSLKESVPVFYSLTLEGKRIDFMVVLVNGEVSSYFDACKECYSRKMGYRHDGGSIVCRTCNVRFPLDRLDTGIGGCFPIKIKGSRTGDSYIIAREQLAAGRKYF